MWWNCFQGSLISVQKKSLKILKNLFNSPSSKHETSFQLRPSPDTQDKAVRFHSAQALGPLLLFWQEFKRWRALGRRAPSSKSSKKQTSWETFLYWRRKKGEVLLIWWRKQVASVAVQGISPNPLGKIQSGAGAFQNPSRSGRARATDLSARRRLQRESGDGLLAHDSAPRRAALSWMAFR